MGTAGTEYVSFPLPTGHGDDGFNLEREVCSQEFVIYGY